MMLIKNATLFDKNGKEFISDIEIKDGKFSKIEKNIPLTSFNEQKVCDVCGKYILPGLCDIHTHGARKCDFTLTQSDEEILNIMPHYSQNGVTMIFPTTVSAPFDQLKTAVKNITSASKKCKSVHIAGIHIEGPYLSHGKRGAHLESYLTLPNINQMLELQSLADGLKMRVTVAPELDGAMDFIDKCVKHGILVSLGHSEAGYDVLKKAIDKGADCFTHLYNAMSPLHHREPGCVGTALSEDVYCELICDGIHVHPQTVSLTRKVKQQNKMVLVTDSIQAAGLTKSDDDVVTFMSAGKQVTCKGDIARTETGELAGSTLGLFYGFYNYMNFTGACTCEACNAASLNPATAVGMQDRFGQVRVGASADFIVYDSKKGKKQALEATYCNGELTYKCQ